MDKDIIVYASLISAVAVVSYIAYRYLFSRNIPIFPTPPGTTSPVQTPTGVPVINVAITYPSPDQTIVQYVSNQVNVNYEIYNQSQVTAYLIVQPYYINSSGTTYLPQFSLALNPGQGYKGTFTAFASCRGFGLLYCYEPVTVGILVYNQMTQSLLTSSQITFYLQKYL